MQVLRKRFQIKISQNLLFKNFIITLIKNFKLSLKIIDNQESIKQSTSFQKAIQLK